MNEHQHRQQLEQARQQAICDRLDKVEGRLGITSQTAGEAHKNAAEAIEHIESIKESLEGAHLRIERLVDHTGMVEPRIDPSQWTPEEVSRFRAEATKPAEFTRIPSAFDFGRAIYHQAVTEGPAVGPFPNETVDVGAFGEATAEMTAALREDLDTICGRDPRNDMVGVFVHSGRNADYDLNWSIECDEASSKLFTRDQLRALGIAGVTRAVRVNGRFGGSWLELEIDGQTHRYNDMAPDTIVNTVHLMKRYRDLARRGAEKGTYPTYAEQQEKRVNHPTATELRETIRAGSQSMADQINRFAGMAAAAISPQRAYNRRMSELMARVAADQERIMAFWALRDRLTRAGFLLTFEREIDALWKSLGSPNRSVDDDQQKARGDGEA